MSSSTGTHLKYRAHVDGLRAVAILPVIFFHAGVGFGGGYVGVDIFFVISGYLISALILKDLSAGQFKITEFWERRARRILPAMVVVVLACLVAGLFLFFPADLTKLGQSMIAQALLVSNLYFYHDSSYFAQGIETKPLLHTWSLAVEEQFYLLFPFLLMGLRRFLRQSFTAAIFLLCCGSFILCVYCSYKHPRANFYLLPTRAWELLIGCFLASIQAQKSSTRWMRELLSCAGFVAILYAVFLYDSATRFPGLAAILPCVGAALIIRSNDEELTLVGNCLSCRPMVFIGMISYSLYLWHWPVLVFYKYQALGTISTGERLLLLLASGILAAVSWKFVETPFRKRTFLKKRWQVFTFAGVGTAVLVLAGVAVYGLQGLPARIPARALHYLATTHLDETANPEFDRDLGVLDAMKGNFYELGKGDKSQPINLMIWGDSHAKVLIQMFDNLARKHSIRAVMATHPQTAPLLGFKSDGEWSLKGDSVPFNNAVLAFIRVHQVRDVLIIARWDYYIDIDRGVYTLRNNFVATIEALEKSGVKTWIMQEVPRYPWDVPKALASEVLHGHNPEALGLPLAAYRAQTQEQDSIFLEIARKFKSVRILDPSDFMADSTGRCQLARDGHPLYYNADHVNIAGAMMLLPLFDPVFEDAEENPAVIGNKGGGH